MTDQTSDSIPCPGPGWEPNSDGTWIYTGWFRPTDPNDVNPDRVETQHTIGSWNVATFGPGIDPKTQSLRLLAEVVELCKASGANWLEIKDVIRTEFYRGVGFTVNGSLTYGNLDAVPGEVADVAIVLNALAYRLGIDLTREVTAKMKTNRSRKWKINGDGTGQHVKEEQA